VALEAGKKRVFATAVDWPGWCRSGRTEELALVALADAEPRYRPVTVDAGVAFPAKVADTLTVIERVPGDGTTDFGAPGKMTAADREPLTAVQAKRRAALLAASWELLERVAKDAPAVLRKGPRGGGRDRDRIIEHVWAAEAAYARKLGVRGGPDDLAGLHAAILDVLRQPATGEPEVAPKGWTPRYAAARMAWHALDHAWEIEDKSDG
jgi:hypothetical protein